MRVNAEKLCCAMLPPEGMHPAKTAGYFGLSLGSGRTADEALGGISAYAA